jgi:hypothetical protein
MGASSPVVTLHRPIAFFALFLAGLLFACAPQSQIGSAGGGGTPTGGTGGSDGGGGGSGDGPGGGGGGGSGGGTDQGADGGGGGSGGSGCVSDVVTTPGGQHCQCQFTSCDATSLECTCDLVCYDDTDTCLINTGADGNTSTGDGLLGTCGTLSCKPEDDLSENMGCSASDCQPPPNEVTVEAITVSPPAEPPAPPACSSANPGEPGILAAFSPSNGQTVDANGQIKVWVNDENPACTGWSLGVNSSTGVTSGLSDICPVDNLPYVALYMGPNYADSGGTPYYPNKVLGDYNNNLGNVYPNKSNCKPANCGGGSQCAGTTSGFIQGMDTPPAGTRLNLGFTSEYVWDVSKLNLPCGGYTAEFMIWDGDRDRASGCVQIQIACETPPPSTEPVGTHACLPAGVNPIVSTLKVTCDGQVIPPDPQNGWTFDPPTGCFTFNGSSASVGGSSCTIQYF